MVFCYSNIYYFVGALFLDLEIIVVFAGTYFTKMENLPLWQFNFENLGLQVTAKFVKLISFNIGKQFHQICYKISKNI